MYRALRVIISGGGTGGHIFPAISIADCLRSLNPETQILFVGARGRMEMDKVPAAGYEIEGLDISGFRRRLCLSNLALPFKVLASVCKASSIIRRFRPDIAIGVGGYASAPLLFAAQLRRVPTLIQEQNGFAGLTNRLLGGRAGCICVAYEGMGCYFPEDRVVLTGNPIRSGIRPQERPSDSPCRRILVIGGSLGAATLNSAMKSWMEAGCPGGEDVEVLWQCGRRYKAAMDEFVSAHPCGGRVVCTDFISDMDAEYGRADLVVSRSGASSVSELCAAHKAAIFVPSPNVAEDHQTHNAMALVRKGAAVLVRDADAPEALMREAMALVHDRERIAALESGIAALALPDAARSIAQEVYKLV